MTAGGDRRPSRAHVVVAHDYLTQRGGAERVALALHDAFPGAPLRTSIVNARTTFHEVAGRPVQQTWLGRVPFFREDPRRAFLLLAPVHSLGQRVRADVVVCSSSGWAHGVRTDAPKVIYCHNPPRWLYQPDDYLRGVPSAMRPVIRALSPALRAWDRRQARSAACYLANSSAVRERIRAAYGLEATVVHPPRGLDPEGPDEPVPGVQPGFLLHVGRPRPYKNADAVCRAVAAVPGARLVCVGGTPDPPRGERWPERITSLTDLTDAQLRWLYRSCSALVALSHEDFGLTPVEAYAFGKPALVLRAGGYLDSTVEGVTGVFVDDLDVATVVEGLHRLQRTRFDPEVIRRHGERFSPLAFKAAVEAVVADVLAPS
ncbi:glycosyltransferase [uncultured Pseudokineococcus sp.]|uniref:glycosyltransferase n=1 Tax=uncultured Pseudokineococcus sp. TaxID=1642928 RepID=UPI0026357A31|nr:glycosyltransferase [uncultured Pseudokineococcus sp.]